MATSRRLIVLRVGSTLLGTLDGINRTFLTPEKFAQDSISVYHNGRRLNRTATLSPLNGDFYVSESGGPGSGFDTVVLISFTPVATSILKSDYLLA